VRKISLFVFKVFAAVIMKTKLAIFWDRKPCSLAKSTDVSVERITPYSESIKASKKPVKIKQNSYRILGYRKGGYGYVEYNSV
jgi:hypothetical protein